MVTSTQAMLETTWAHGGTRDVYADFNRLTLQPPHLTLEVTAEPPPPPPLYTRDVYADFNRLTLEITLEALFGFTIDRSAGGGGSSGSSGSSSGSSGGSGISTKSGGSKAGSTRAGVSSSDGRSGVGRSAGVSSSSSSSSSGEEAGQAEAIVAAVAKAFDFFTRRAGSAFTLPEWVPTLDNLEFGSAVSQLNDVVYDIIASRRRELAAGGGSTRGDLLQSLLTAVDDQNTGMSDRALRDELMTMLVAGQETSAILLGWASALLAHHPRAQDAVAAELESVLQGRTPTAADARSLPYTEAVVLEALRLYAPAYMVGRCASCDTTVGPYSLPAGTTVLISPYILHRDPAHWDDPDTFSPERWARHQAAPGYQGFMTVMSNVGEAVGGAYVPFGAGPRNCIGTGFAMMEAILVIASLVQRYRLSPSPDSPGFPEPKPMITLRPEAVPLSISRR
ncbi:hypothetical protein FOA52_008132 [Chlamydomonas sp. UWO 241]|nr:hypothetical protein FOA52_008132 [Chlamydomonas sp. UWO 241]